MTGRLQWDRDGRSKCGRYHVTLGHYDRGWHVYRKGEPRAIAILRTRRQAQDAAEADARADAYFAQVNHR